MSNIKKELTIVIPIYNTDIDKLERCLKSIPDHKNVYVYIYDDCSTKYNTEVELSKIINGNDELSHLYKDGNKFIRFKENKGLGFVRNQSINDLKDSSRYILFLDSDDEIDLGGVNLSEISQWENPIYPYSIKLIDNDQTSVENCRKYLCQKMIPYLITPIIYNTRYLYENGIMFDDSRRVFEDIPFSVKLWTKVIMDCAISGHSLSSFYGDDKVIYKYYLDGESLTRNNNKPRLLNDLNYWVEWIKEYYSKEISESDVNAISDLRSFIFNRIRYEVVKILSLKMEMNGDLEKYKNLLDILKPYNIHKVVK